LAITPFVTYNQNSLPLAATASHKFIATFTAATIIFSIEIDDKIHLYIDDVSVSHINAASNNLLINGDFEQNTIAGWNLDKCQQQCNNVGYVTSDADCHGKACFKVYQKRNSFQYLHQMFSTVIGEQYSVSFYIKSSRKSSQRDCNITVAIV
jgi:hypothetical protein